MASNQRVAVVTGTSSGNGYETSLILARNGLLTYATMRNLVKGEKLKSVAEKEKLPLKIVMLDVTDEVSVKNAIQSITTESSRIDVLVNNAGYAVIGAFEDLAMEEIKAQYETNLFGVIRVTQAVLPIMRKQTFSGPTSSGWYVEGAAAKYEFATLAPIDGWTGANPTCPFANDTNVVGLMKTATNIAVTIKDFWFAKIGFHFYGLPSHITFS